jgi:AraC family transcriptional regulator of adaptative response / DNA-3-methyladenine glycosylase II
VIKNDSGLYEAFKAKDARFDGRFFVGVSSTGIYCRPVCRAKLPKKENCTFYSSSAEAEQAGFRPCLLCRPELAPGTSISDAKTNLAVCAARILEEKCGSDESMDEIAAKLGYTDRHVRRVFNETFHVTPVQFRQTCRLLLAKSLLTDTGLPILEVAMAAGFGSLRRFNAAFKGQYKLRPTALRKQASDGKKRGDGITLALGYRPPYRWETLLQFFAGRTIHGVEKVENGKYYRAIRLIAPDGKHIEGWICVGNNADKKTLSLTLSESLLPVLPQVLSKIKRQFDLYCDPNAVYDTLKAMNELRPGLCEVGTRLPGCFDPFEMAVRAVLGQQITVKAAGTLAVRIAEAFGSTPQTGIDGLTHTFPSPEDVLSLGDGIENRFGELGVTSSRSRTILELARVFTNHEIDFELCENPDNEIRKLTGINGIGDWTANYIAMRTMGYTDAFLETDYGVKKALTPCKPKEILQIAENWRPWRSYAIVNLWNSL